MIDKISSIIVLIIRLGITLFTIISIIGMILLFLAIIFWKGIKRLFKRKFKRKKTDKETLEDLNKYKTFGDIRK